jgi:hypothetical protein
MYTLVNNYDKQTSKLGQYEFIQKLWCNYNNVGAQNFHLYTFNGYILFFHTISNLFNQFNKVKSPFHEWLFQKCSHQFCQIFMWQIFLFISKHHKIYFVFKLRQGYVSYIFEHCWLPMDENTLKSPKIIIAKYIFLCFKILTRYPHQTWWQYCVLWVDLKILQLDLINSSKKNNKRWRFYIC